MEKQIAEGFVSGPPANTDTKAEKKRLRSELRQLQSSFCADAEMVAAESRSIWKQVEETEEFARAGRILLYMDIAGEVPTLDFLMRWHGRKRFVLPVVKGDLLELREFDPDRLRPGYKGILEPDGTTPEVAPESIELALIPGTAFARLHDGKVARMGRGGGFYDRLLPQLHCPLVGICFSFRVLDKLPMEAHDFTLDALCSG